jgi:genome maintenance exonuclease 1
MLLEYHDGQDVELEFNEKKHYYTVDGEYAPSVTTILDSIAKPALIPWAANEGAKFFISHAHEDMKIEDMAKGIRGAYRTSSGSALNIGMEVHKWCEEAILWKLGKGEAPLPLERTESKNAINAFREWVKANDVEWLTVEEKVYHRGHKYAGTVDATAIINDEYCVIDFKTSGAIYSAYHLQCAAYAKAIENMRGKEVDKAYVLRFDKKTGEFEAGSSVEILENFMGFLGFLDGYNRLRTIENRKGK